MRAFVACMHGHTVYRRAVRRPGPLIRASGEQGALLDMSYMRSRADTDTRSCAGGRRQSDYKLVQSMQALLGVSGAFEHGRLGLGLHGVTYGSMSAVMTQRCDNVSRMQACASLA